MKRTVVVARLALCLGALCGSARERGVPVFADDFSQVETFAENWESTRGAMSEGGRAVIPAGNHMTLRRIPEGDFRLLADVTIAKPVDPAPGHFGVKLEGWINLLISPSRQEERAGAHTAYTVPGEKHARGSRGGAIPGFAFGKPLRIECSRTRVGEGHKYAYEVNGQPVDSFIVANLSGNGKILFYGYRTDVTVDNVQLLALTGEASNNRVVNSSFEHLQEGRPLYMKPATSRKLRFGGAWTDFLNAFAIDTREKVSGRQSARMTLDDGFPGGVSLPSRFFSNGVWTHDVSVSLADPVTFSVYLKASRDGFPARLTIWEWWYKGHSRDITISRRWERYAFTVDKLEKKAIVRGIVTFGESGTLWADDLQIEVGPDATPYRPSALDADKFTGTKTAPAIEPDTVIRRTARAPVLDGLLEDLWFKSGVRIDRFFFKGGPPENQTTAWAMCDADTFYLAVRAHVPDLSAVKGGKLVHDSLTAHSDDCIEILLDPAGDRKNYFHLTANAAGATTDFGPGRRLDWDGDWSVAVAANGEERAIDYEFRLPLVNFAGPGVSDRWGLNIGRNDTAAQKVYSLTRTTEALFHVPELFPSLVFSEGVTAPYRIGPEAWALVPAADSGGKPRVTGVIVNGGGRPLDAAVTLAEAASGRILGRRELALAPGDTAVALDVEAGDSLKELDARVTLTAGERALYARRVRIPRAQPLEVYTRLNYYMNESNAVLVGAAAVADPAGCTVRATVAGRVATAPLSADFAIDVPLAGVADGVHTVRVDVCRGGTAVLGGTALLVKRPFRAGATQIDRQRRCLVVDGRPYLVIAPFFGVEPGLAKADEEAVFANMLRHHREMGYRCFHVMGKTAPPQIDQARAFFARCRGAGIKIIYWPGHAFQRYREGHSADSLFTMQPGDNIIGWLAIDEPELGPTPSEEVEAFLLAHQAANPYTPVFMNNSILGIPRRYANLETDILMLDDYLTNRENRKVAEMIDATEMMMEAGREGRKPVFYFLAGENLGNHYREPTYAEQVAQTYGVILAGARGVSYFCSLPLYPEHYRACVDVNRELLALEDDIFSLDKVAPATCSDAAIRALTCRRGNRVTVIALNTSNERAVDAVVTLPPGFAYGRRAEVKFEDRRVKVKDGRLADRFAPLQRHVYVATFVE